MEENPYQLLKEELDRTNVISEEFKGHLLGYMMRGMEYAAKRARVEANKYLGIEQDPHSNLWYVLDENGERKHGPYQTRPHMILEESVT